MIGKAMLQRFVVPKCKASTFSGIILIFHLTSFYLIKKVYPILTWKFILSQRIAIPPFVTEMASEPSLFLGCPRIHLKLETYKDDKDDGRQRNEKTILSVGFCKFLSSPPNSPETSFCWRGRFKVVSSAAIYSVYIEGLVKGMRAETGCAWQPKLRESACLFALNISTFGSHLSIFGRPRKWKMMPRLVEQWQKPLWNIWIHPKCFPSSPQV